MKKLILAVVAAGLLTTGAMAQTTVTTGIAREAVQIEPEYRTMIKTYVNAGCAFEGIAAGTPTADDLGIEPGLPEFLDNRLYQRQRGIEFRFPLVVASDVLHGALVGL